MKTKLKTWAVKLGKFVLDSVMDKLILLIGGLVIGGVRKGWKSFRAKRAEMNTNADSKTVTIEETETPIDAEQAEETIETTDEVETETSTDDSEED